MKRKRRWLAFILAVCIAVIPVNNTVYAAERMNPEIVQEEDISIEVSQEEILFDDEQGEVTTLASSNGLNAAVKNKILGLKSKFPEGKNWDPNGTGWNNRAWECYGFAITMAGQLFKDYPTNAHIRSTANGKTVEGWTCYYVTSSNYNSLVAEPGDIIDCPTSTQWNHTAMVLSVDNGVITCVQANNGGNNYVYWTQCFNYNKSNSTLKNIYNKYSSYITGSGSKVLRLWKPSESLKIQATGYTETPAESTLTISGASYPGNVNVGSSWTCKGTISSNYTINHVGGYILGSDNSTVIYSKTVNPNATSYSLANGDVDKALLFNKLSAGTYYYKITAKDSSGKSLTLINSKFTVGGGGSSTELNTNVKDKILSFKSKYPEGYCWDDTFAGGSQCYGFALLMANDVFGKYPSGVRTASNGTTSNGWTCYTVTSSNCNSIAVEPGDLIDAFTSSSGVHHTAMVLSVSGSSITCVQCNIGSNCLVYWTNYFNYNSANATLSGIVNRYGTNGTIRLWKPSEDLKKNAKEYTPVASTLGISSVTKPGNIDSGSSWTCTGTISSNYKINEVSGYILGSDNSTVIYSKTVNPNATSYSLANSEVDKALLFDKLSVGTYYYKITAKDWSGKNLTLVNEKFSIIDPCDFIVGAFDAYTTSYVDTLSLSILASDDHGIDYFIIESLWNSQKIIGDAILFEDTWYQYADDFPLPSEGTYMVKVSAVCNNGTIHDLGTETVVYEGPEECSFLQVTGEPQIESIIRQPILPVYFSCIDEHSIKYDIVVRGNNYEQQLNVYPSYCYDAVYDGEFVRVFDYKNNLELDLPTEGTYTIGVNAVCSYGITHDLGERKFEYKLPVISFVIDENQQPIEVRYEKGTIIEMPADPVREGYIFKGWYTEKDGKGSRFTADTEVSEDIKVFAYWLYHGEVFAEDIPSDGVIPQGIWTAGIEDMFYTGNSTKQNFRVYDGNKLLKEKKDYTITYKNIINAYTYLDEDYDAFEENLQNTGRRVTVGTFNPKKAPQLTIKMKGNYSGSQTIYFKIEPIDIAEDGFTTSDLTVSFSGKKQTPVPILRWNGKSLKYGTDFYVPEYDSAKKDKTAFTISGTYDLTIVGKKNFTGEIPITLTISESAKQIAMSKVTVTGIKNQIWTGEEITPIGFTVKYKNDVLMEENDDYYIEWGENTDVGTGTVTFIGTGTDEDGDGLSYIGSKTVSFMIKGKSMSKVVVSGIEEAYKYTGDEIVPEATLSYQANKYMESEVLIEDIHYTVAYQKNVNKGTATIVFTGLASGGYTGTKKQTFKIIANSISEDTNIENVSIDFKDTENIQDGIYIAPYMKGGAKPEVVVTSGDTTLQLGKDYIVSYSNNKKVALSTDEKAPSVTVKGMGNYTGSKRVCFTIKAKTLSNENGITVVAKDKVESKKKNGYRQSFKVYDADGKALGSKDYDTRNVIYTLIQTTNEDGTINTVNEVLDKNSIVPAGSVIQITVQGKGIYGGGEATGTYRILESSHDISKAIIQIDNQTYTGSPVLITDQNQFKKGKVFIKIGKEKKELILGTDFEVVPGSYVKNVNKGTAKVTFRGINDFGGTKTVSFKIGTRSISEFWQGIYAQMMDLWDK